MNILKSDKPDWFVTSRKKNLKHVKHVLIVLVVSYCLFFATGFIPEKSKMEATELRTAEELGGYKEVTLIRWDYCKSQKRMEIELNLRELSFADAVQSVSCYTEDQKMLPVTVTFEDDETLIVAIDNVPSRKQNIYFQLISRNNDMDEEKYSVSFTNNIIEANRVDDLTPKSEKEYKEQRRTLDIAYYESIIKENKAEIETNNETIKKIEAKNKELKEKTTSMTASEIEELNVTLDINNGQIQSLQEKNEQLELENTGYKEKIDIIKK